METSDRLIDCPHCKNWQANARMKSLCNNCNNSKLIENPKYILCNMCGDSLSKNEYSISGLKDIKVSGGYYSYYLLDNNLYKFNLCEKCLRELFMQFKIKPLVNEIDWEGIIPENIWEEDQAIYEYRVWVDSGEAQKAYKNGKCNYVKECINDAIYTQFLGNSFTEKCCCEEHKNLFNYANSTLVKFIPDSLKPFL